MKSRIMPILLFVMGQIISSNALATDNSEFMKASRKQGLIAGKIGKTISYGKDNNGKDNKGEIWVFTDLGCPACHKLHNDIAELNRLGVSVHVMAFPRQGIPSPGYTKMVNIWCSKDPADTLSRAMQGESIPEASCENPVRTQFTLGQTWGIAGTPTIVFADGTMWGGYFAPERLAKEAIARKTTGSS